MFTFLLTRRSMITGVDRLSLHRLWLSSLMLCIGIPAFAQVDGFGTQRVVQVVELTDLAFIRSLLEEQFIQPEDPEFTHAVFL